MKSFKISVWRPARFELPIQYFGDKGVHDLFQSDKLQEQVYNWIPGDEDIRSHFDKDLSEYFREILIDGFAPHIPPKHRSMKKFDEAIRKIISKTDKEANSFWIFTQQKGEEDDESVNLRMNILVSLINHLRWIHNTFEHVPGASIVIR